MEVQRTSRALPLCSRVTPGPFDRFRLTWSSPQQRFPSGTFSFLGSGPAPDRPGLGFPVWSGQREAELGTGTGRGGGGSGRGRGRRSHRRSHGRSGDSGGGRGGERPGTGEGGRERRRTSRRSNKSVESLLRPPQRWDRLSLCPFVLERENVC